MKQFLAPSTLLLVVLLFPDADSGFKVVRCTKGDGKCQKFCNYMEFQLGYCSKKKDACCLPLN
ncbi:unnamed protein product [Rangifer tarandus platyrhynchus]|uniref:Beta-defensin n=1 Tax=Rangifer tarandus platyrhynchus TaxID=3082113 RepID=A0ABN8ZCI2_RANTA|nr:beta-defensin 110-like [Odocoileus virginianus texanus]CAI9171593.1 unnamed protein product [Rangifer tarandus platyrhynchus]